MLDKGFSDHRSQTNHALARGWHSDMANFFYKGMRLSPYFPLYRCLFEKLHQSFFLS